MTVTPIQSGSKGNATLVEANGERLLIDCGVCKTRLKKLSFSAILITHEHIDHCRSLAEIVEERRVPVYANASTSEAITARYGVPDEAFMLFENGQTFEIGPFTIRPFSIAHDVADPVGYLIAADGVTYFHCTDTGTPLASIGEKLAQADMALLESNHDLEMLLKSSRPDSLKERIRGPRGHLSNDQTAELVAKYASPRLKCLALAHLSEECNRDYLAERSVRTVLQELGRTDIDLQILTQATGGHPMTLPAV